MTNYLNYFKIIISIMISVLLFNYLMSNATFYTISPDSVRFMHFWQINFDHLETSGFTLKNIIQFIYFSLKSSTIYDFNRGRYLQYIIYGIDGLTRSSTPNALMNYIMILFTIINSLLISKIVTNHINEDKDRINLFCLTFLFLNTLSYSFSPIILLILYGKYIWATFILSYFVTTKKSYKILWLLCSSLADELGFLAALIIFALTMFNKILEYYRLFNNNYSIKKKLIYSFLFSLFLSLLLFFAFYGISSTLFNVGSGFASLAFAFAGESINGGFSNIFNGLGWLSANLLLGFHTQSFFIFVFTSIIIFGVIFFNLFLFLRTFFKKKDKKPILIFIDLLNNKEAKFYIIWISLFIFINIIIIPGGVNDFTHRSYPRFLTVTILFLYSFLKLKNNKVLYTFLFFIIFTHFLTINKNLASTSNLLTNYLLPDSSVKINELNNLRSSILYMNKGIHSDNFEKVNNFSEIDFSGTWYYSRKKNYDTNYKMHYPVEGTARVLIWPQVLKIKKSNKVFDYKSPTFKTINN